jgi:RNA polymerase sigma-54 factor
MSMKPTLQVRLSQHLALTPQLQQSIRLLQLSTLELQQEIDQMLETNPFLENDDEGHDGYETPAERGPGDRDAGGEDAASAEGSADAGGDGGEALAEVSADDFGTAVRDDWANGTEDDDFDGIRETPSRANGEADGSDDETLADRLGPGRSLREHLQQQLMELRLSAEDRAALEALIDSLDDDGYLPDTLDEVAGRLAQLLGITEAEALDELRSRLQCALNWLHTFDPPGVGARTLTECLALQLRTAPDVPARRLAIVICREHLELLARRDYRRLSSLTGADEALIRQAQSLIVACEPKPGRPFSSAESNVIVPDVIVQRSGRGLKVALNPDVLPKLRINDIYAQAVRGHRNGSAAALASRLQEARWFVKNVQQRFDTILRVSKAIVERQKNFFSHGAIAMRPLVLREIADELGLHESTISRVTTAKYMATPQGTFELKYFFGSSLATEAGGNASSTAVRALIRQLVAAENPGRPLSDSQLAQMLEEQGIQVARRTVAKYREALKIAPAALRRAP